MSDRCPHCKADLRGEKIPDRLQVYYDAITTHYSRAVAVYDREKDRRVAWKCPDCGEKWDD